MTIKFDPSKPFTEFFGKMDDNARYEQGGYRFKPDRTVIGNLDELEADLAIKELADAEARVAKAKAQVKVVQKEQGAAIKVMEKTATALKSTVEDAVAKVEIKNRPAVGKAARVFIYEGDAYNHKELNGADEKLIAKMIASREDAGTDPRTRAESIEFLLSVQN